MENSFCPWRQDIEIAERMNAIGNIVKLPVIDHLIVSEDLHYSLVQGGKLKGTENTPYHGLHSKAQTLFSLPVDIIDMVLANIHYRSLARHWRNTGPSLDHRYIITPQKMAN